MAIRMIGDAERHSIDMCANALSWLLSENCELEAIHPGLRHTLIATRTQIDAAQKLAALPPVGKEPA